MTALDRINVTGLNVSNNIIRSMLSRAVWQWYHDHKDEVVFEKRVLILNIKLRIRDLKFLIERIAGPENGLVSDPRPVVGG